MASILKLLALCILLSCFLSQGNAECSLKDIKIKQNITSFSIHGKPEYSVTIFNDCICQQYDVHFDQTGFETTEEIDPSILNKDGLVNNGQMMPRDEATALVFKYAWDQMFTFKPISSMIACSK